LEEETFSYRNFKSLTPKRKKKAEKILDIVLKIRTIEDISLVINKIFGGEILNKIISPDVDEKLIERIDSTIKDIEKLMEKGKIIIFKIHI